MFQNIGNYQKGAVELTSPLTDAQLQRIDADCRVVHFYHNAFLEEADFIRISEAMKRCPNAILKPWGADLMSGCRLDFLKHFPTIRRFCLSAGALDDFEGLRLLPSNLERLELSVIDASCASKLSLDILSHFTSLVSLQVSGRYRDCHHIGGLSSLESLSLRDMALPDLSILTTLPKLRSLELLETSIKNFSAFSESGRSLAFLHLVNLNIADVQFLSKMQSLQFLRLSSLKKVQVLPSFASLNGLRRVEITALKLLNDLSPISTAPHLQDLILDEMKHLQPVDFSCFKGHSSLQLVWTNIGTAKKDVAVKELLGLPSARTTFHFL